MNTLSFKLGGAVIVACILAAGTTVAKADAVTDFFQGRTVTWTVGAGAGGGYSVYAQIAATFLSKHLPGNPTIIVQTNPGGGGRQAAAYVSNAAPRDGSVLGMTQQNVPIFQVLDPKPSSFDASQWLWIGNLATISSVLGVWHEAPATTLEDMKNTEIVVGATGRTSETFMNPTLSNSFVGTKFKIVLGYQGSRPLFQAMERGEIHAFALSYQSFSSLHMDWIREGKVLFPMQTGLVSDPDPVLKDVPLMWQLGRSEIDRDAMRLVASASKLGRSLWLPAGVPQDRVAAWRRAFDRMVQDKDFLEEVEKRRLPFSPSGWQEITDLAAEIYATDAKVVDHARKALGL